jgi:hypothetical protein
MFLKTVLRTKKHSTEVQSTAQLQIRGRFTLILGCSTLHLDKNHSKGTACSKNRYGCK